MTKKPTPCPTCGRAPVDGCSRVECASRKPVTAQALGRPVHTQGIGHALRRYTPPEE